MAEVGPVTAILNSHHLAQRKPGAARSGAQRVSDRGDKVPGPVANQDGRRDPLPGQDCHRVTGDLLRYRDVRRIREVIAEAELDAGTRRGQAKHDEALAWVESQQVRYDGKDAGRRIYPDSLQRRITSRAVASFAGLPPAATGRASGWQARRAIGPRARRATGRSAGWLRWRG